jgi:hypothetical protein
MKFRTFRILAVLAGLTSVGGLAYLIAAPGRTAPALPQPAAAAQPAAPAPTSPGVLEPSAPERVPAALAPTDRIRAKLDQWLTEHPNRQGKTKLVDIFPNEPFRVTLVRFPEQDAVKWSNDPGQWSQVRIDLNRDGHDDEKWLLKNGRTYKRETLDSTGRVVTTSYFK